MTDFFVTFFFLKNAIRGAYIRPQEESMGLKLPHVFIFVIWKVKFYVNIHYPPFKALRVLMCVCVCFVVLFFDAGH